MGLIQFFKKLSKRSNDSHENKNTVSETVENESKELSSRGDIDDFFEQMDAEILEIMGDFIDDDDDDEDEDDFDSPSATPPLPEEYKTAVVCDVVHGRRTNSDLPFYETALLGKQWKEKINNAFELGYIKVASQHEKLPFCQNKDLKQACRDAGLKVGGNKADLVKRLESVSSEVICSSIPYDVWIRTREGDDYLDKYAAHVENHKTGGSFSDSAIDYYVQLERDSSGRADVQKVFYWLHKERLFNMNESMTIHGAWSSLEWQYRTLYKIAMDLGDYERAIDYKARELTIRLSGMVNGGIVKGFEHVKTPTFRYDFYDLLFYPAIETDEVKLRFMKSVKSMYEQLPFHFFDYDELERLFLRLFDDKAVDLDDYNPHKQYGSENYNYYFRVEKDENTGELYLSKN